MRIRIRCRSSEWTGRFRIWRNSPRRLGESFNSSGSASSEGRTAANYYPFWLTTGFGGASNLCLEAIADRCWPCKTGIKTCRRTNTSDATSPATSEARWQGRRNRPAECIFRRMIASCLSRYPRISPRPINSFRSAAASVNTMPCIPKAVAASTFGLRSSM
jgi:hypothetical protein